MSRCLVITSHVEELNNILINKTTFDCIICADAGYLVAKKIGISPDILIGDFDSMTEKSAKETIKLPCEKDLTDSEAAIDLAVERNYEDITVLGGLGGRFDHTMGNIGLLAKYLSKNISVCIIDGQNKIFMMNPGKKIIEKENYKYLGVISYGQYAKDVTLEGVKYPLSSHLLTNETTLGVSNEILKKTCTISFSEGKLLIILSKDIDKPLN